MARLGLPEVATGAASVVASEEDSGEVEDGALGGAHASTPTNQK